MPPLIPGVPHDLFIVPPGPGVQMELDDLTFEMFNVGPEKFEHYASLSRFPMSCRWKDLYYSSDFRIMADNTRVYCVKWRLIFASLTWWLNRRKKHGKNKIKPQQTVNIGSSNIDLHIYETGAD